MAAEKPQRRNDPRRDGRGQGPSHGAAGHGYDTASQTTFGATGVRGRTEPGDQLTRPGGLAADRLALRRGPPDRATCGCAVQVEDGTTDLGRHKAGASLAPRSRRVPAARSGFSQPWGQAPPVRAGLVCGCRFSQGVPLPAVISHRMPVCGYTVERRPSPSRRKATPAAMSPAGPLTTSASEAAGTGARSPAAVDANLAASLCCGPLGLRPRADQDRNGERKS